MDSPDKFDNPPASPANRLAAAEFRATQQRDLMQRWNDRARALGYEGVSDLLTALEARRFSVGKMENPRG